jgi:cytidyltransferase-like protein
VSTGVLIGRFQPLHWGHIDVLRKVFLFHRHIHIILGSSNMAQTVKNPWDTKTRQGFFHDFISHSPCIGPKPALSFSYLPDYPTDTEWFDALYSILDTLYKPTIYAFPKDASCEYLYHIRTPVVLFHSLIALNATDIRQHMSQNIHIKTLVPSCLWSNLQKY